jgi:hypothetical protein
MLQCRSGKRQEISTITRKCDAHRPSQSGAGGKLTVRAVYTLCREVRQFLEIRIPIMKQFNPFRLAQARSCSSHFKKEILT